MAAVRFKRVAEAFDEAARARRLCESSGSEHSPETASVDLSFLVKSFIERDRDEDGDGERERDLSDTGSETLRRLLGCDGDDDDCDLKRSILAEIEKASRVLGDGLTSPVHKRRLMIWLRERGFDASLCKSKWETIGRLPSGSYEYIDINVAGTRYIIEFNLAGEFEIARPTESYTSLLQNFPPIFVGKAEELKQVVRLMCNAIKDSMKSVSMHVPPWRRFRYVQAKWFGSYKQTTKEVSVNKGSGSGVGSDRERQVGFGPLPEISYYCREDFAGKVGLKIGQLAIAFNGSNMLL